MYQQLNTHDESVTCMQLILMEHIYKQQSTCIDMHKAIATSKQLVLWGTCILAVLCSSGSAARMAAITKSCTCRKNMQVYAILQEEKKSLSYEHNMSLVICTQMQPGRMHKSSVNPVWKRGKDDG